MHIFLAKQTTVSKRVAGTFYGEGCTLHAGCPRSEFDNATPGMEQGVWKCANFTVCACKRSKEYAGVACKGDTALRAARECAKNLPACADDNFCVILEPPPVLYSVQEKKYSPSASANHSNSAQRKFGQRGNERDLAGVPAVLQIQPARHSKWEISCATWQGPLFFSFGRKVRKKVEHF